MARASRTSTMVLAAALAALLLLLASAPALATAARAPPAAAANKATPEEKTAAEADCEGGAETAEEECLARRTLAAHTDYIYTQEHHN